MPWYIMFQLATRLSGLWLLLGSGSIEVGAVNYGGQTEPGILLPQVFPSALQRESVTVEGG
ncbi:MAG TPA: hypothetical protein VE201_06000, partial [Nitrospirales bacterium]|nr:hypothetical protein [Nitrospirales bacterium]